VITSTQKSRAVTATLHWLAKNGCRIQNYLFFDNDEDRIEGPFDIVIDDNPTILAKWLDKKPLLTEDGGEIPRAIGVDYAYNEHLDFPILNVKDNGFDGIYDILAIDRIMNKE
jgi:hypothetical protein